MSLFFELGKRLRGDLSFRSGRVLGSMCTRPHRLAVRIFKKYIEKNIGDPGLVRATKKLEQEAVEALGVMLHAPSAGGYILTGGTEANILAVWTARKLAGREGGELLVPESAHFSFDKAADMLGVKVQKVKLDSDYRMDVEDLKRKITPETIAIVAVAGTTSLGVVDPVDKIAEIARKKGIYLHVDAAFGGFVLPFLNTGEVFDFSCKGVSSITIDPHKMGMAVIPSGGILYRNRELAETVRTHVTYLSGGETRQSTIVGTRSGASVIAVWGLLNHLGREGYQRVVRRCMQLTAYTAWLIKSSSSLELVAEPIMNVIGFRSTVISEPELVSRLRDIGWAVSLFKGHIRICLMPHVKKRHVLHFIKTVLSITTEHRI